MSYPVFLLLPLCGLVFNHIIDVYRHPKDLCWILEMQGGCHGLDVCATSPQHSSVEALTTPPPSVAVFGDGASKEVIKFDEFIKEEP